jgi:hypothetical protein
MIPLPFLSCSLPLFNWVTTKQRRQQNCSPHQVSDPATSLLSPDLQKIHYRSSRTPQLTLTASAPHLQASAPLQHTNSCVPKKNTQAAKTTPHTNIYAYPSISQCSSQLEFYFSSVWITRLSASPPHAGPHSLQPTAILKRLYSSAGPHSL